MEKFLPPAFFKNAQFILDLIFPVSCFGCGKEGDWLCPVCFGKITLADRTRETSPPLDKILIACDYKNQTVKKLILNLKYNFIRDLAGPIGKLMSRKLSRYLLENNSAVLIPVPLHKKRLRWRGFNQAELLANEINRDSNIPVVGNALIRHRHALPQAKINDASARKENIRNSFAINPDFRVNLKNKTVILIDDICTTGATLAECARALKPLQPKQIWALVFANG